MRTIALLISCMTVLGPTEARPQGGAWPMKAHDVRRTGQSTVNGPLSVDAERSWTVAVPAAHTINIGATVTETGVFFGSWGLLRRDDDSDPRYWNKHDGAVYGYDLDGSAMWGDGKMDLDFVDRCYEYDGRGAGWDIWCGFTPYQVTYYNGTVEGQAAYDVATNRLYFGRGDGKLYAVNASTGVIEWRFESYNPLLPDDPDGGGEIVTSPIIDDAGVVYFGTWAEGPHETNAFYAVAGDGDMRWRFPSDASLSQRIFASPALSPDEETIYVATYLAENTDSPAILYALRRFVGGENTDETRLKWAVSLDHDGRPVHATTMAVGLDGTIYIGGFSSNGELTPVVTAIRDKGSGAAFAWEAEYVSIDDGAQYVGGIGLRESDGVTRRLYATTTNLRTSPIREGSIVAIEAVNGDVIASFAPRDHEHAAIGGLTSPAIGRDGVLYFGVQGRLGVNGTQGHYFGVSFNEGDEAFEPLWHVMADGYVEWNHPAIGPDGGLYAASSSLDEGARGQTYLEGTVPDGTTAWFHAIKGPTSSVARTPDASPTPGLDVTYSPNPFSEGLYIRPQTAGPVEIRIYDVLGRRVYSRRGRGGEEHTWDGKDESNRALPAGLYLIRVVAEGGATKHGAVVLAR